MDTAKLTKDYTNYIWKFKEKAPKEDLEYLYVDCRYSLAEIANILNSTATTVKRWLSFYGINKPAPVVNASPISKEMLKSIDWSKVSRNFFEVPWTRNDIPIKEDFEYFYIDLNWSAADIALMLGRSESQICKILQKLGIKKPSSLKQESREKMNLRNYGVKFANTTKEALAKKEETNLKKYGVKSLLCNKDFKEQAMLAKHGVKHALELEEFLKRMKETNLKNLGVPYSTQSKVVQQKIKDTLKAKYNTDNVFKLKEFQEKARETFRKKYGVSSYAQEHIKHIENMTKEYWETNFYNKSIDAFDIDKCASYHNISFCTVGLKLKEFNITLRTKYSSKNEFEIKQFLENEGVTVIKRDRKQINPLELDLYLPDNKLAVEFDGLAFHSSGLSTCELAKDIPEFYHLNKTEKCEDKGIQLFHIFENEWLNSNKKEIWKSMLLNKVGKSSRIYARKTIAKLIKNEEAVTFCNNNHIQGGIHSSVSLGLFYSDELVAVMTFSKPRFNKNYDWELVRYCCKKYYAVIGGASKLLKFFRSNYQGSIISYANRRWSNGSLYEKLGFDLLKVSKPSYFYFKVKYGILPEDMILHSRMEFQKHKLKDKLKNYDASLTEKENMYLNNYRTIYDCGNLVYVLS